MRRSVLMVFLAGVALFSPRAARGAGEYPQYVIEAQIDCGRKQITARQVVRFTNNTSHEIREIPFHLYPHRRYTRAEKKFMMRFAGYFKINPYPEGFQSGDLRIHSVRLAGEEAPFKIEGKDETILTVPLKAALRPAETMEITLEYVVDIPHAYGRFGWHDDIIKLSRWYPILAVYGENGWSKNPFYPFHRPFFSEAAHYQVEVTVPAGQVVVHSGLPESTTVSVDGRKTLVIKSEWPIREFTLAMSPAYQRHVEQRGDVRINSYYLPGDQAWGVQAAKDAGDLIEFYSERFGPYPYKEFSIAPVHLGYGGEQMANMIFIDTRVYQLPQFLKRYFDFLIAHETGHQWFFNLVGMNEFSEMWLEEGVNSYFTLEYLEDKYGANAEIVEFPGWLKGWKWLLPKLTFRQTRDFRYKMMARTKKGRPVVSRLSSFQEPSGIFSIAYGKGSAVLRMLKKEIGEENFYKIFRRVFRDYRFRNLSVADFVRIGNEESGRDLGPFFRQWLYTDKKFDYAVQGVRKDAVVLKNRGGITLPADVQVEMKDGRVKNFVWDGKTETGRLELGAGEDVRRVSIDPSGEILDIDRTNNHWPRQLNIKPVPLYVGLYDLPLFLPEDSYSLVFGPEIINNGLGVKVSLQKPYDQNFYFASGYEFGEALHHSRVGYQINNLFSSQTSAGFEIANRTDLSDDGDDLVSGKIYLRRELWPAQYGLAGINDHISFYVIRNQGMDSTLLTSGREDTRHTSYLKRDEAIGGALLHLGRGGPYPDPRQGFNLDMLAESSGHFMGATQYFHRASLEVSHYVPVTAKTQFAFRLKYGWGYPDDKNLYQLGGWDGLRGYERKTVRGANAYLGSVEYRFPIKERINKGVFDNVLRLESIQGVVFFDAGQGWFADYAASSLKKDAGFGLRFTVDIGSFLEKVIVRADIAQAINDSGEDTRFWFGINHAF
ncbi:MAG: M1 family aminopeptidase [Candidatus Omnitrophota bacterium]